MKIPRKAELIRLQELYRTDAKIAEALGGIPEYLVTYWRRKKGIARHTAAKFTDKQVTELWERYGDDFRCGRELNISKAAFYSWRRKYGILEKPPVLKLEQLELHLGQTPSTDTPPAVRVPKTAAAKILQRCIVDWPHNEQAADWQIASRGDGPDAPVAICPGPVLEWPRGEPTPETEPLGPNGERDSVWCLPTRGAVVWQIVEGRTVLPGQLIRGSKSLLGGLGGIGALVVDSADTDPAARVIKIEITRRLPVHSDIEDVFLALLHHGWETDWKGATVEFWGGPIERLPVDRKVKLCALTTSHGAAAAICPFDDVVRRHYGRILQGRFPQCHPDRAAEYDGEHFLEGRSVATGVGRRDKSGALSVSPAHTIPKGSVIVGPDALPYELEAAADLLRERRLKDVAGGATLLVSPATRDVFLHAHRRGWAQTIINAGGSVLDLNLARRLGPEGLLALASGAASGNAVITTRPLSATASEGSNILFAGVRTAIQHALDLV